MIAGTSDLKAMPFDAIHHGAVGMEACADWSTKPGAKSEILWFKNWEASRYLVYLNNAAGKGSVNTIDLCDQKTAP
jgi:hypothetical protein